MAGSRGKQRSRDKHKRRREARKVSIAARQVSLAQRRVAKKRAELAAETEFDEATATRMEAIGYDAATGPVDVDKWLGIPDDARRLAIEFYHQRETPHDKPVSPRLHSIAHLIVENQLAEGMAKVAETLDRLMTGGQARHDAVHAIGAVMMAELYEVRRAGQEPDPDRLASALAELAGDDAPPRHKARRGRRKR